MAFKPCLFVAAAIGATSAQGFQIDAGPDWQVHWDNTVSYNLGMRVQSVDDKIGDNPLFNESDYKFSKAGDIVTNRIADLSEFDAVYKNDIGFRVSGSAFNDFAFDDDVEFNPGEVAPGTPYSALSTYSNNKFSSYTKRYYQRGAQLLDAFVFGNFDIAGHASSVRIGRLTQFWGNALIFGAEGINYSQNASDNIKALNSPGTQAKELAIPRAQFLFQTALTPTMTLAAQVFGEFYGNRLPEGGTYLGTFGFAFSGPDQLPGGAGTNGGSREPGNFNSNYGLKYTWSPDWMSGGNVGAYYRRLDEVQPWLLFGVDPGTGAVNYHLSYNENVKLYGLSLDQQIGQLSTGFEASYRQGTALNSATGPLPTDLSGRQGPRGNTINLIANVLAGLTPTALYQTGTFLAEVAVTHKVSVTSNQALYNGVDNASGCPSGSKKDGCSTDNAVGIAAQFDPQWLQVFPGVDLDTPVFAQYGISGNGPSVGGVINQGTIVYTAGVHAFVRQRYNLSLQYNGFHAPTNGLTNAAGGAAGGVPLGTPGFPSYYNANNQQFFFNDKGWVSLTFSTVF
nr:DUF1302 family protein [Hydrocarboniphaga sp.]